MCLDGYIELARNTLRCAGAVAFYEQVISVVIAQNRLK
jgi:hypothetical protein